MSSTNLEQQTMTVSRLISQSQWALVVTLLTSAPSSSVLIDNPCNPHAVTADIIIHFAARFQAPLRIISLLSRMYPQSLSSSDVTGRYPIHVAAKWGATPDVVAYLIKTNPSVAGVPDQMGKTPMHYVGEYYLKSFKSELYGRNDSMLQVVRLLTNAAPQSVNLEDNEGTCAIEYALGSNAHLKVIKMIQRACRDDWRERSESHIGMINNDGDMNTDEKSQLGRRRHQDLVRDMEAMSLKLQRAYSNKALMDKKVYNDRVHVHRSRVLEAKTVAARTA